MKIASQYDIKTTFHIKYMQWSKSFRDVINLCLQKDPKKRPSCEQLLLHRQFKGFSNEEFSSLRRKQIVEELCNVIDDVGEGAMGVSG